MAQSGFTVARDWELAPSAIPRGGSFRLLYVTSNARNAESSDGNDYNAFVWALAGITGTNRHSAMTTDQARRSYGVWCTSSFDSNAITDTTGTGVPIYWLNGNKVADNYADFYDGGWDDEANPRDESGTLVTTFVDRIWTGCNHDGTGKSGATLGHSGGRAAFGGLNHSSHGPLSNSGTAADTALQGRLYGITRIYTVEQARIEGAAITSTPRNTTRGYFVGEEIRVRIRYNEPVAVTRANDPPSVWLKVGNEVRRAWYASGSGTADLVFAYTVQSGDVDTNGVSLCSDTSLHRTCGGITKNGGTIMATADDTTVPLNYPEMSDQAAHGIGGPQVIGVAMQSAPASGDSYAAGETVTVRLTFAEAVDVTGRPFVYLNVGGAVRKAVFASGSGSANLDFAFTVQAADFDANGVSVCSSRLLDPACGRVQLDGGAIVASADALVADLALPAQADQSAHKVDGMPVTIDPGQGPISRPGGDPAMGSVPQGWALLPAGLNAGDKFRLIFISSGTRNATSTDIDDYNSFVQGAAAGGHAAIRGYSGGFRALASTAAVDARDNTATTGTGVPIYWLNGNKVADDYADLYDGAWDDERNRKNEHGSAKSGRTVWTGSDHDGTEDSCNSGSLALGSRTECDEKITVGQLDLIGGGAGPLNSATQRHNNNAPLYGISQVLEFTVIPAKVSSARIVSRPASGGAYAVGETVAVELGFGEDILVRGTPQFELELDSGKVVAGYVSGSGTGTLRFEYVVQAGDYTERIEASLDEDGETALRLGGATITDAVGDAVDPGTPALANNARNQRVEARPPAATGVSMASSPASGDTYGVGETVTVRLTMREDVTVVLPGRPHVWLEVGGAVRRAEYSGPVGSATRALEFSYTVQEGDLDTDGVRLCSSDRPGIDCGRIHLNGGTIRASRGGLDAVLGTPRQGAQAGHKVGAERGPSPAANGALLGGDQGAARLGAGAVGGRIRRQVPAAVHHLDDGRGQHLTIGLYNTVRAGAGECGHSAIRRTNRASACSGAPFCGGQRQGEHLHHRHGQRHRRSTG